MCRLDLMEERFMAMKPHLLYRERWDWRHIVSQRCLCEKPANAQLFDRLFLSETVKGQVKCKDDWDVH